MPISQYGKGKKMLGSLTHGQLLLHLLDMKKIFRENPSVYKGNKITFSLRHEKAWDGKNIRNCNIPHESIMIPLYYFIEQYRANRPSKRYR